MRVYGLQLDIAWEQPGANQARVLELLQAAPPEPGSLLVLPEMFATGFSMNAFRNGDATGSETAMFLAAVASKYDITVLGGLTCAGSEGRGRNEARVFGPDGREISRYAKLHPFSYSGEHEHYEAGTELALFQWGGFTVAPLICYDLRFPEAFRAAQKRGAEVFAVIANWPAVREQHWLTLLQARAIENQCYVVGVNRCGNDPKLAYSGRSLIIDPRGEILTEAGNDETLFSAVLNKDDLSQYRAEFPVLADQRADL